MGSFKLDVLKIISDKSTPYCDIQDLEPEYDIRSDNFTSSFLQLEKEGLISSNSSTCGLRTSADGLASWSIVDLHVTEEGKLLLNPSEPIKEPTSKWLAKPVIVGVVLLVIGWAYQAISSPTPLSPPSQDQNQSIQPNKEQVVPPIKSPPKQTQI